MPATADIPAHLWGKTQDELLREVSRQQTSPAPTVPAPARPSLPDENTWFAKPNEAAQQVVDYMAQQRFLPAMQAQAQQVASTVRALVQNQHQNEFAKWAGEIDALVQNIAPEQRTIDLYREAVNVIRGRHVEELVEERIKTRLAQQNPGERSSGTDAAPFTGSGRVVDIEQLPPEFRTTCQAAGVKEADILEFCRASDTPPEAWMEMAKSNKVFVAAAGQAPSGKMAVETTITGEKLGIPKSGIRWRP